MKRLLTMLIGFVLLFGGITTVYAEENPSATDLQGTPVEVRTLTELSTAIEAAQSGDTIAVSETIIIESDCIVGTADKKITLICSDGLDGNMIKILGGNVEFVNLIFDGETGNCSTTVILCENLQTHFENCEFINNGTASVGARQKNAKLSFYDCGFKNNNEAVISMRNIGELEMDGCSIIDNSAGVACISVPGPALISDCIFQSNATSKEGGVLMITAPSVTTTVSNCQFIDNTSIRGTIHNLGALSISSCMFYGNSSEKEGNDICALDGGGTLTITDTDKQLAELYATHGLQYYGVFVDSISHRYRAGYNNEKIEIPLSTPVESLCFVSEKIPSQETEEEEETGDIDDDTPTSDIEDTEDTGDITDTDNTDDNNEDEPEDTFWDTPEEPQNPAPEQSEKGEDTTPDTSGELEDTTPDVSEEAEDTTPEASEDLDDMMPDTSEENDTEAKPEEKSEDNTVNDDNAPAPAPVPNPDNLPVSNPEIEDTVIIPTTPPKDLYPQEDSDSSIEVIAAIPNPEQGYSDLCPELETTDIPDAETPNYSSESVPASTADTKNTLGAIASSEIAQHENALTNGTSPTVPKPTPTDDNMKTSSITAEQTKTINEPLGEIEMVDNSANHNSDDSIVWPYIAIPLCIAAAASAIIVRRKIKHR